MYQNLILNNQIHRKFCTCLQEEQARADSTTYVTVLLPMQEDHMPTHLFLHLQTCQCAALPAFRHKHCRYPIAVENHHIWLGSILCPWPTEKSLDTGPHLSTRSPGFLLDNFMVNFIPFSIPLSFRGLSRELEIMGNYGAMIQRHQPGWSTQHLFGRILLDWRK